MENMKGVVKKGDGKINWDYIDVPRRGPMAGEVEIAVKCIGICGSELHLYHDNHFYSPGTVIGHEFCGQITRVGEGVTDWKVGDRVVAEIYKGACGKCEFCRRGMPAFCGEGQYVGYDLDGGWADYYITPEEWLLKLPDNVSYEEGCMVEPTSVLTTALIIKKPIKGGDIVVIQGCGTIGMIAAMVAKAAGASKVIMTGTDVDTAVRLPIAEKLDCVDRIVNVQHEDLKQIIMEETNGFGADVIVECSGSDRAIVDMFDVLRTCGTICVLGETAKPKVDLEWNKVLKKSCEIQYNFGEFHESWTIALRLISSGKMELEKLITHRLPLSEYAKGFDLLDSKEGLKVLLIPEASK